MTSILRWFDVEGTRYRAYYRTEPRSDARTLIVAGPDGQVAAPGFDAGLDDIPQQELRDLVARIPDAADD